LLDKLPWVLVLMMCVTLGLAPFTPEPHVWEKIRMLAAGDLVLHASPWLLALAKLGCGIGRARG